MPNSFYDHFSGSSGTQSTVVLSEAGSNSPVHERDPPLYENVEDFASFPDTESASLEFSLMNSFLRNLPPPPSDSAPTNEGRSANSAKQLAAKSAVSDAAGDFRIKHCRSRGLPNFENIRPLSIPMKEMQRLERQNETRTIFAILSICTIFVFLIAFCIWYFFEDIQLHLDNIAKVF